MAQTRPVPHRQLSRLQIPTPFDQTKQVTLDGTPLFAGQSPSSAFHSNVTPQMLSGPAFQTSNYFPNRQLPPHLSLHRPRQSIAAASIPLPPTPGGVAQPVFPSAHPLFSGPPQASVTSGRPGLHMPPSRRTMSVSLGGPPKAVLGGPRKVEPSANTDASTSASTLTIVDAPKLKGKKCIVKLPAEASSVEDTLEGSSRRSPWARNPVRIIPQDEDVPAPPDVSTAEIFPESGSSSEGALPNTIEVFLPGKGAWEEYKNQIIEEKLARLGVEKGSRQGPFVPGHAHGRANSISSPADPALLLFKLNKLQQTQSSSVSPQPSLLSEASSGGVPPYPRHGHTMSLAYASSAPFMTSGTGSQYISPQSQPAPDLSPFGTNALLAPAPDFLVPPHLKRSPLPSSSLRSVSETEDEEDEGDADQEEEASLPIFAPQAKTPIQSGAFQAPLLGISDSEYKPDFSVGFGLDASSDDEDVNAADGSFGTALSSSTRSLPNEDINLSRPLDLTEFGYRAADENLEVQDEDEIDPEIDDGVTEGAFITPSHSRQPSNTLSYNDLSKSFALQETVEEENVLHQDEGDEKENIPPSPHAESRWSDGQVVNTEDWTNPSQVPPPASDSGVGWTDSEVAGEQEDNNVSDTESTGEWSNPSDEERHREERRNRLASTHPHQFLQPPSESFGSTFGMPLRSALSDDIVSNPSEEENVRDQSAYFSANDPETYFSPIRSDHSSIRPYRPLPLPPNSDGNSLAPTPQNRSAAHSRSGSFAKEKLNPLAKPFVFGRPFVGGSPHHSNTGSVSQNDSSFSPAHPGHTRQISLSSKLNAAAAEFKPSFASSTSFNFKPPPGMPALTFSDSVAYRPLPVPPVSPRAAQGREKRQRQANGETLGIEDEEPQFQFPPQWPELEVPPPVMPMPRRASVLNPEAKPFTFGGFSMASMVASVPTATTSAPAIIPSSVRSKRSAEGMDDDEGDRNAASLTDFPSIPRSPDQSKSRRPPIPDFRHPVSTNTVPASLFKALANGDGEGPTRPTVRSRLSSRDLLLETHGHRASLDDINLPSIARRSSRAVSQPGSRSPFNSSLVDVFTQSPEGGLDSLPSLPMTGPRPLSGRLSSFAPSTSTNADEAKSHESDSNARLLQLLDDKFNTLRRELLSHRSSSKTSDSPSSAIRAALSDFIPVLQTQLQTQLAEHHKSLGDGTVDAQGELDYEVIHNLIEQGHHELRASLQRDIAELAQALEQQSNPSRHVFQLIEDVATRTINTINGTATKIVSHFDANEEIARRRPGEERQKLLQELLHHLIPHINSVRSEPLDVDRITAQLTQAVKPHISQLIDLASDKKETAALILQHLMPVLTSLTKPQLDINALSLKLRTDLTAIMPHVDPHHLKEEVADLVVERLDSRLAIRDGSLNNHDALFTRLSETLLPHFNQVESLVVQHNELSSRNRDLLTHHADLQVGQAEIASKLLLLPDILTSATSAVTQAQVELVAKSRSLTEIKELQEAVKNNSTLQTKLGEAEGAVVLLTSEKSILGARISALETDNHDLRSETVALRDALASRDEAIVLAETKTGKLESTISEIREELRSAGATLQAKDVELKSIGQARLQLEEQVSDLQNKLDKTEQLAQLDKRDLKAAAQAQKSLEKQRDQLLSQKSHWEDLHRTADQVDVLAKLLGDAEQQQKRDLHQHRDRANVLEGELSALRKLHSDQEEKLGGLQRASITSKQTVANAQQRASEWEKQAKSSNQELEICRSKLEQSEEARAATSSELENYKVRVEEQDSNERASQVRENQLKNQVSSLESQLLALRAELGEARSLSSHSSHAYPTPRSSLQRGSDRDSYSRPSSRLSQSTEYPSRPSTATPGAEGTRAPNGKAIRAKSPLQPSVRDSMHAPIEFFPQLPATPRPRHAIAQRSHYIPPASPTLSTVSAAPTQQDDGWWT